MKRITLLSGLAACVLTALTQAAPGQNSVAQIVESASVTPMVALAATPATAEKGTIGVFLTGEDGPAEISSVIEGGPAEKLGLAAGDVIVAINGKKGALKEIPKGKTVNVYWLPDPKSPGKRFAKKIDVILSEEELEARYKSVD